MGFGLNLREGESIHAMEERKEELANWEKLGEKHGFVRSHLLEPF